MTGAIRILLAGLTGLLAAFAAAAGIAPVWALALGGGAAFGLLWLGGIGAEAEAPPAAPADRAAASASPEAAASGSGRGVVDRLPVPLLVIGRNGRVLYANPAAETTLPRLETGTHFTRVIRVPAFVEAVTALFTDGRESSLDFTAQEGAERHFEARIGALPPGSGFGPELTAIVRIDDRSRAHKAEQLRSDFIANASHELRTPLASIIGYVETLQNHARDDAEARERFLAVMAREAGRMQRLVDDLMSLSRIEMSEHERPVETVSLYRIAAESAAAFLPIAEREDVRLVIDLPAEGGAVTGDRDQLAQVFGNLVDNALKYGGPGVEIAVRAAEPGPANPGRRGVTVSDTGPGIDRAHLHRLTERFYRVSAGQSRSRGGTGLGLAIVKHILNRHRGRLEIASEPGEGSRFTIWLPRADPEAESGKPSRIKGVSGQENVIKS